jgi:hypothetical protein
MHLQAARAYIHTIMQETDLKEIKVRSCPVILRAFVHTPTGCLVHQWKSFDHRRMKRNLLSPFVHPLIGSLHPIISLVLSFGD